MKFTFLTFLFLLPLLTFSQKADTLEYCLRSGSVGVGGYDPVSYFRSEKSMQGKESITSTYRGVEYRFMSEANKNDFIKNPSRYLPQYGGWCSMTLAMGRATRPKYDNFLVKDGKLFLFERTVSVNGRELWLKDPKGNAKLAAATYKKFVESASLKK